MLPQRLAGQIGRDGAKVTTFPLSTSALARLLSQEVERPAPEPRAAEAKAAEVMPGPLPTLTDTDPLPPAAYRARPTDLLPNLEDGPTATFTAPALSGRTSAPEIDALYDALAERLAEEFRAAYGTGAI